MTVRRNEKKTFDVEEDRLANVVREMLRKDRAYRDVEEHEDENTFTTVFRPSFMFGATGMRISLDSEEQSYGPGTIVDVTVVSPKFAYADAFGGYNRMIHGVFSTLESRIEDPDSLVTERGLTKTWHGRWTLAISGLLVAFLTVLPVILWLLGFEGLAVGTLFYPVSAATGFGLAYLISLLHRRSGLPLAVPAAIVGFIGAFAVFIAMDFVVSGLLNFEEGSGFMSSNGLVIGVIIMAFTRLKPDDFDGEVSDGRDLRGGRSVLIGMRRGARHWLLGEPHFPGNLAMLILHLLVGTLGIAFAVFILANGSTNPAVFAFLLLGVGILLYGTAETVSLGPRWATVAGRIVGLLGGPVFLFVTLVAV